MLLVWLCTIKHVEIGIFNLIVCCKWDLNFFYFNFHPFDSYRMIVGVSPLTLALENLSVLCSSKMYMFMLCF